ncbi:MAG TPA: lipase, partial [Marmoricola sp.]
MRIRLLALVAALAITLPVAPATAAGSRYAPLDRPGPALHVSVKTFKKALLCHGPYVANHKEPVLLIPATGVTPKQNYSWNYERAFTKQKRPWCTITMPQHTLGDIQRVGEYIVRGIRTLHRRTHRKIAVMGHSQGGMSMRWALRFWPGTRTLVTDVIGMAGSNHGTTAGLGCKDGKATCTAASWQQQAGSNFIKALNSRRETFPQISYTEIYSHTDEVVQPAKGPHPSSAVRGGHNVTNVATQSICSTDVDEHLLIGTIDPVTYALVMDALTHA